MVTGRERGRAWSMCKGGGASRMGIEAQLGLEAMRG